MSLSLWEPLGPIELHLKRMYWEHIEMVPSVEVVCWSFAVIMGIFEFGSRTGWIRHRQFLTEVYRLVASSTLERFEKIKEWTSAIWCVEGEHGGLGNPTKEVIIRQVPYAKTLGVLTVNKGKLALPYGCNTQCSCGPDSCSAPLSILYFSCIPI